MFRTTYKRVEIFANVIAVRIRLFFCFVFIIYSYEKTIRFFVSSARGNWGKKGVVTRETIFG